MNKKITILMVAGVVALSGFASVLTGSKASAVNSGNMQDLKNEIAETNEKLKNQMAFLENLAVKADKYIKDVALGKLEKPISPSKQAERYLSKLNDDDAYVKEYREVVRKEIKHIEELAEKSYKGVYDGLPELKEMQERIGTAILALTDEANYIAHIENKQNELLNEKDLSKAEQNAKTLKMVINNYFNKLRKEYGSEFLLADKFELNLISGIDNVSEQIKQRKIAEEELQKSAQEEADKLKKDEEDIQDAWDKIGENNQDKEESDLKDEQQASEIKMPEPKKEDKPQILQAPNTGFERSNVIFQILTAGISLLGATYFAIKKA